MNYVRFEVALVTLSAVNNNIMQACSTIEEKEFQLAIFRKAISDLSQSSFRIPITHTRVVRRETISAIIGYDLFSNKDYTAKYGLK